MGGDRVKGLAERIAVVLVACASVGALGVPNAAAADIYSYANGCYALRDATTGRFVVKDALGYAATASTARAAHALPPPGHRPRPLPALRTRRAACRAPACSTPSCPPPRRGRRPTGASTDGSGDAPATHERETGRPLGVGALSRLAQLDPARDPRWSLRRSRAAARAFPEIELNVSGTPFKGDSPTAPVRGFLDDHIHLGAFEFLSGNFHCGRPWSPYGVTVALRDCVDHYPNGAGRAGREPPLHRQPRGHAQPRGLAELQRLAARRVARPRGHLLEVDRARLARRGCG